MEAEGTFSTSPAASCTGSGDGDLDLLLPDNLDDSPSLWLDMIQELMDLPSPSSRHFGGAAKLPAASDHALLSSPRACLPLHDIAHMELSTQQNHRYFFSASAHCSSAWQLDSGAADLEETINAAAAADADHPFPDKSFFTQMGMHDQQSDYGYLSAMNAEYASCPQLGAAANLDAPPIIADSAASGGDYGNFCSQTSDHLSPSPLYDYAAAHLTADSRFPLTGSFSRFSGGSAKLIPYSRPAGTLQKVYSAPQLTYPPFLASTGASAPCSFPQTSSSSSVSDKLYSPPAASYQYHSFSEHPYAHNISFDHMFRSQLHMNSAHSMHDKLEDYIDFIPIGQQHYMAASSQRGKQAVERGLELVHLLLACAEAIAHEDHEGAKAALLNLEQLSSKTGSSMQRVGAYFAEALHAKLTNTGGRSHAALLNSFSNPTPAQEVLEAYQVLYQVCPYIKFAHFTCNQAIFEAFEGEGRVHIVDLDIMQGYQWPAFIQALAARPGGAPHLRITGVGTPLEAVQETGKRLGELAESLHVSFEFHAVGERLENLKPHMLQRRVGEALAINSITRLHSLPSSNKSLPNLLHMLLEQAPNIFTLVEQDASHNGPFFLSRFLEALHYYSAIFDSLDASLPQHSLERAKVEKLVFAQEILNIVACEGMERVERHEKLDKWRIIMETIGFQSVPLSANAINQSKILLGLYPCFGYMLKEDKGALLLGWQDRLLIGASAWCC